MTVIPLSLLSILVYSSLLLASLDIVNEMIKNKQLDVNDVAHPCGLIAKSFFTGISGKR
jgi:hypothetical protein